MQDRAIRIERAQNLWTNFVRSLDPMARGAEIHADPQIDFDDIGGLSAQKEEILTYACASTSPDTYSRWGTFPPSGVLLIGPQGVGKGLLAAALATRTQTSFVHVDVPRVVIDVVHRAAKAAELIRAWERTLEEMPPLTVFFDELEFSQAHDFGHQRSDLPLGPIMDFLLELIDLTIANTKHLVVGSTGYPGTLRHAFARPGRFERVVEITPRFPDDVIAALAIHCRRAEERAGRRLFDQVDWPRVVGQSRDVSPGDWVRILHAVLRRKARCEATGDAIPLVASQDFDEEIARFDQTQRRIRFTNGGNYV